MAIWYEVEKSQTGIKNFLDSNWSFHDFRIEKIEYIPSRDMVEMFLKYDTQTEGVLLRFLGVHDVSIAVPDDYEADYIFGCSVFRQENNSLIWLNDEVNCEEQLDKVKQFATWVKAQRIIWAITDGDGNPIEMPTERIDQVWNIWGKIEEKHFDLKEFDGDWDNIY